MKSSLHRIALITLLATVVGCSTTGEANKQAGSVVATQQVKYAVTIRFIQYIDQRQFDNPRFLGQLNSRVSGIYGNELIMDQDIAEIATAAIKKRFDTERFQVLESADEGNALFEVSGVIKELTLNVKNRDEINISIETTMKDLSTGEVFWSGTVTEKSDRFAGVTGNNKADLDAYLNKGLRIVSGKTVEAIAASLMVARPELFNLTPGTKAIRGVDVVVAPPAASHSAVALPVMPAHTTTGLLSVKTNPSRAKIYLDGVYYGLAPLSSEIEPGVHDVVVKLKGYKTTSEKVSVRKGDKTELELSLDR